MNMNEKQRMGVSSSRWQSILGASQGDAAWFRILALLVLFLVLGSPLLVQAAAVNINVTGLAGNAKVTVVVNRTPTNGNLAVYELGPWGNGSYTDGSWAEGTRYGVYVQSPGPDRHQCIGSAAKVLGGPGATSTLEITCTPMGLELDVANLTGGAGMEMRLVNESNAQTVWSSSSVGIGRSTVMRPMSDGDYKLEITRQPPGHVCTIDSQQGARFNYSWQALRDSNSHTMVRNISCEVSRYQITSQVSGGGGQLVCSPTQVPYLGSATCTATDNVNWKFERFINCPTSSGKVCNLSNISSDQTVTASFVENSYTISVAVSPPGAGTVQCDKYAVKYNERVVCQSTANPGYWSQGLEFMPEGGCLTGSGSASGYRCTISITNNTHIVALFEEALFTVSKRVSPGAAAGSLTCSEDSVRWGASVSCTAMPKAGYEFVRFDSVGNYSCPNQQDNVCLFENVTKAVSVLAVFAKTTYTIDASATPANTGSISCALSSVEHGASTSCTAIPQPGYRASFEGCDSVQGDVCSLTNVTTNRSVQAVFGKRSYDITGRADPEEAGTVSCSATVVDAGGTASCNATANTGYQLQAWTGCDNNASPTCTLADILEDKSVTGQFAKRQFTVTAQVSSADSGSITCEDISIAYGEGSTCTAHPEAGYSVRIEGCDSVEGHVCRLSNVTDNRSVMASFDKLTYSVQGQADPIEAGAVSCNASVVDYGNNTTCHADTNTGWQLQAWTGCDSSYTEACTLTGIQESKSVTALLVKQQYSITTQVSSAYLGSFTCEASRIEHGDSTTCTAAAQPGARFVEFEASSACAAGTTAAPDVCVLENVTSDLTVQAHFEPYFSALTVPAMGVAATASAHFTGGGLECRLDLSHTAFVAAPETLPNGQTMPHGMLDFKLLGCDTTPVTVSIIWPSTVQGLTKWGKASADATSSSHFEPSNLAVTGNTTTFTVQDGQLGDDDWSINGEIVDPVGATVSAALPQAVPVPTLGYLALALMSLVAAGLGLRGLRKN